MSKKKERTIHNLGQRRTVLGVLREVRNLYLDNPQAWITGQWVSDANKNMTTKSLDNYGNLRHEVMCDVAGKFCRACLDGALILASATSEVYGRTRDFLTQRLKDEDVGTEVIHVFNDQQTEVGSVIEFLDRAIDVRARRKK